MNWDGTPQYSTLKESIMKALFRVFGAGRVNMGTYGNKSQAMKAMRALNSKRKQGERPFWVGPAEDHWRFGTKDEIIPMRPSEYVWTPLYGEPVLLGVSPAAFWLDA